MAKKVGRSARTGKFVKPATVRRHPKTTLTQTVGTGRGGGGRHRSAVTGRFISEGAAKRNPSTSIRED